MRALLAAACAVLAACAPAPAREAAAHAQPSAVPTATQSPRALASAALDCTVSWVVSAATLSDLARRADVVVRAAPVRTGTVTLTPGFGAGATRDAHQTVFAVRETLKGTARGEISLIEDVCPGMRKQEAGLSLSEGDEWLLFLRRADEPGFPAQVGHYWSVGGPQGQFRITRGAVAGPYFRFQRVVRAYDGVPVAELLREARAAVSGGP